MRARELGNEEKERRASLVILPSPLPIHAAKASDRDLDLDLCIIAPCSGSSRAFGFCRPGNGADDLGVAHLQIAGAVGGGLGADLGSQEAELVPSPAVETEERKGVGGSVEWHFRSGVASVVVGESGLERGPDGARGNFINGRSMMLIRLDLEIGGLGLRWLGLIA